MGWSRLSFVLVIVLLLAGCSQRDTIAPQTPTPFTTVGATFRAPVGEAIPISLTNLAANPGLFEGSTLQLTGQFQPLPRLICEQRPYPSPATWGIVADGLMASATGQDKQLRNLIADGQQITAEGRWLRYVGPVGCGKSAPIQEVWYLSLSRIISPHPLARATGQPPAISTETEIIAEVPATETPLAAEETPDQAVTATLEVADSTTSTTATATLVPTFVPSPEQPGGAGTAPPVVAPSLVPSPTTTTPSGTLSATPDLTATATATSATGSATATSTSTPGPSPTASSETNVDKGLIDFEDLIMSTLAIGSVDRWTVEVDDPDSLTITIAPAEEANLVLSLVDESGQIIVDKQDLSAAGEVETISAVNISSAGTYRIEVRAQPEELSNYALMVLDEASYDFNFQGTLEPDVRRSDALGEENDHFWFFNAVDGDTINLQVTPTDDGDAYVELYGKDGSRLLTVDDEGNGTAEVLDNYSILATGMYAVRVGEFDFSSMSYQIILTES